MQYVSISVASKLLGIAISTLRCWEYEGKFKPSFRTVGKHRRYDWEELKQYCGQQRKEKQRKTIAYARVSSHDQKEDLERQKKRLENYCKDREIDQFQIISDLGSGLNYNKKGFKKLLKYIAKGEVKHLILVHKDRLLRFGSEIIFQLCKIYHTKITIIETPTETNLEKNLVDDVIELMTVFTARLHGARSQKNKRRSLLTHINHLEDSNIKINKLE